MPRPSWTNRLRTARRAASPATAARARIDARRASRARTSSARAPARERTRASDAKVTRERRRGGMKLLVEPDLAALNAFLSSVNVGDYVVSGQMESYSCACRRATRS